MKKIRVIGINHKNSNIEVREKFYIDDSIKSSILEGIKDIDGIEEVIILSTCNRTDIYYVNSSDIDKSGEILKILESIKETDKSYRDYFYIYENYRAIFHIFEVVAGLNSMVLGENDIINQFKQAYKYSEKRGFVGKIFQNIFHCSLEAEKIIKCETNISAGITSMSHCAVDFVISSFENLSNKSILIIGGGNMARDIISYFKRRGINKLNLINKNYEKILEIGKTLNGKIYKFEELDRAILDSDLILTSTSSREPLINFKMMNELMKIKKGKLYVIDIALPRDVELSVGEIDNLHLTTIDELENIINENLKKRKLEVERARKIIEEKVNEFINNLHMKKITPGVIELRRRIYQIAKDESLRCVKRNNLDEDMAKIVERNAINVVNKIIGLHMAGLKKKIEESGGNVDELLTLIKESFGIYE